MAKHPEILGAADMLIDIGGPLVQEPKDKNLILSLEQSLVKPGVSLKGTALLRTLMIRQELPSSR